MEITLTPEMQELIERRISAGEFQSPVEVVVAALQARDAEESAFQEWRKEFDDEIGRRLAALDRGESVSEKEIRKT